MIWVIGQQAWHRRWVNGHGKAPGISTRQIVLAQALEPVRFTQTMRQCEGAVGNVGYQSENLLTSWENDSGINECEMRHAREQVDNIRKLAMVSRIVPSPFTLSSFVTVSLIGFFFIFHSPKLKGDAGAVLTTRPDTIGARKGSKTTPT
jgi:hypothetical protein